MFLLNLNTNLYSDVLILNDSPANSNLVNFNEALFHVTLFHT